MNWGTLYFGAFTMFVLAFIMLASGKGMSFLAGGFVLMWIGMAVRHEDDK